MSSTRPMMFSIRFLRKYPELLPLVTFLSGACAMAGGMITYSLVHKSDVAINKNAESPPWERINPNKQQKFLKTNMEYKEIPEVEKLRKEIGSYKY